LKPLKKAAASELVLLSQDEARFSLIPTLRTTLGVKGHRPLVGNLDGHDGLYGCGALNLVTGQLTTRIVERPRRPTRSKQHYLQAAFARHLRDIVRAYPAAHYPRVVVVIDHASWHRGAFITAVLQAYPHLELYPLPSYSPKLQVIERFWKVLRRRATHNRLFPPIAQLKRTLRNSLCYYQTLKHRVLSVMQSFRKRSKSSAACIGSRAKSCNFAR
jgi:transposase